jgi:hypothetical protein
MNGVLIALLSAVTPKLLNHLKKRYNIKKDSLWNDIADLSEEVVANIISDILSDNESKGSADCINTFSIDTTGRLLPTVSNYKSIVLLANSQEYVSAVIKSEIALFARYVKKKTSPLAEETSNLIGLISSLRAPYEVIDLSTATTSGSGLVDYEPNILSDHKSKIKLVNDLAELILIIGQMESGWSDKFANGERHSMDVNNTASGTFGLSIPWRSDYSSSPLLNFAIVDLVIDVVEKVIKRKLTDHQRGDIFSIIGKYDDRVVSTLQGATSDTVKLCYLIHRFGLGHETIEGQISRIVSYGNQRPQLQHLYNETEAKKTLKRVSEAYVYFSKKENIV